MMMPRLLDQSFIRLEPEHAQAGTHLKTIYRFEDALFFRSTRVGIARIADDRDFTINVPAKSSDRFQCVGYPLLLPEGSGDQDSQRLVSTPGLRRERN